MDSFFIDANGNYFEAIEPIEAPAGATVVPQRPGPAYVWSAGDWQLDETLAAQIAADQLAVQRAAMRLSFAQLLIGLVTEQWITEADGEGWLTGTLPAAVTAVINSLPEGQRFAAKARALRPSEVLRADPLVAAMGLAAGKTEAEIDTFFRTYAQV